MLERSATTVRVREPFVKWLQTLPDPVEDDISIEVLNSDPSVYLVYEMLDEESKPEILETFYQRIMNAEFSSWWTDTEDWPYIDTLAVFHEWFDISYSSFVEDLVEPVEGDNEDAEP